MSAGKLPEGWVPCKLEDTLLKIVGGGTPSKAIPEYYQGDIPWMSVKDMNKHTLTDTVDHITPDAVKNSSTNIIPAGIPIIATRMSLGKIVTASFDSAINQDLKALFLANGIERNFFLHWYRSQAQLIENLGTGTTVKGIRLEVLNSLPMKLPPLAEQKIIAEKLDTLLAQVNSTKARLEQLPQILKRFRQAVLIAAVNISGKFETKQISVGSLCLESFDGPFGSKLKTSDYALSGIRVVRLENIGHLNFNKEKETFISLEKFESLQKNKLFENDILFSSFVDEDVRVCLLPKSNEVFINKADCFCLRVDPALANPQYLAYVLASKASYDQIKSKVQGITRPRINLKTLRSLTFNFPSVQNQIAIVRRVEQLFAYADTIEKQVNNALARVNNLTQSILAKAFRGELTAQWRAENPELISGENSAAALLEKIKAERAASGGKKASRKKS
ncbi:restriction endonuclease subunit S [Escherichia albertii]|uniref:restriction endonuclease subunit S n=1 Tax=Escherichia albertii TaxID=208962 RepID=UPI000721263F|nr:restriction endonuclease subunit S [Escherichia albertii]EFO1263134.1 restriction endonuclease subunit S [Escherichia albertii]EGM8835510.1 restriction endonuclease subunit S [Escherichia albertii]EJZ9666248.1 restriction endonuclease subunit S [Escherichia albertii]EKB4281708.1 restriction endonuclease subunit S [Escherichia albertii]MCQ8916215.1 restriction endonuclease subunit S [Escherichia albertii]